MSAPLSKYWVVEYHFQSNTFEVSSLPRYLRRSQKAFRDHKLFDSAILGIHPSEQGALDEFGVWAARKEKFPFTLGERVKELRRCADLLELLQKKHGDDL